MNIRLSGTHLPQSDIQGIKKQCAVENERKQYPVPPSPAPHPKITQTHETITKWNIIYLYNTRHMNLGMWFKEIHHDYKHVWT